MRILISISDKKGIVTFLNKLTTFYSEIDPDAQEVAKKQFPQAVALGNIKDISQDLLNSLVWQYPYTKWLVFGGPPCTDVSLLKSDRAGAYGECSVLREEFGRIFNILHVILIAFYSNKLNLHYQVQKACHLLHESHFQEILGLL